jgi:hypothetical protein
LLLVLHGLEYKEGVSRVLLDLVLYLSLRLTPQNQQSDAREARGQQHKGK